MAELFRRVKYYNLPRRMGLAMKNDGLMGHEWDVNEMIVGFHGTIWENHGKMVLCNQPKLQQPQVIDRTLGNLEAENMIWKDFWGIFFGGCGCMSISTSRHDQTLAWLLRGSSHFFVVFQVSEFL